MTPSETFGPTNMRLLKRERLVDSADLSVYQHDYCMAKIYAARFALTSPQHLKRESLLRGEAVHLAKECLN